ncbi:MAG: histidine phosphatase family protein [Comamonas sp.]
MTATAAAIWLQRHAQPLVARGICYGATDMPADAKATEAAAQALLQDWREAGLPPGTLWHSPLQRCEQLAHTIQALEPDFTLNRCDALREMDFGAWEGRRWDDIDRQELQSWTDDFWHYAPGGGEPLAQMMERIARALQDARNHAMQAPVLWITHAGVIQGLHWQLTRGGRQPSAREWPSVKPAYGEWLRLPLSGR